MKNKNNMIRGMIEKIFNEFPKITLKEKPSFKDNINQVIGNWFS